jgi:hypothetical protein
VLQTFTGASRKNREVTHAPPFLIIGIFPDFLIPICRITQGKGMCCKGKQNRCHGVEPGWCQRERALRRIS